MNTLNEVKTRPTLEQYTRRQFSGVEKKRLLAEMDGWPRGEKGAWLRRNGLYAVQLLDWRKTLHETGTKGLEPQAGGRKSKDPRVREVERLKRDKAKLEHRLETAEELIELQKKLSGLHDKAPNEQMP